MSVRRFTRDQIMYAQDQVDSGRPVKQVCDEIGASVQSFYRWKRSSETSDESDSQTISRLKAENSRLQQKEHEHCRKLMRLEKRNKELLAQLRSPQTDGADERRVEVVGTPKTLSLSADGLKDLVFKKVSISRLSKSDKQIQVHDLDNPLHAVPLAVADSLAIAKAHGLYVATASPEVLMKYADGTLSSVIIDSSKQITGKAGYATVTPASVFAPVIVFQALSMATGQYYLHGITKQLNAISRQLEHLIHLHHNEKRAVLSSCYEVLQKTAAQSQCSQEDLTDIRSIYRDANSIRHEYIALLNEVTESRYTSATDGHASSRKKLQKLHRMLDEDPAEEYIQTILCAEQVLFAANLLLLKGNIQCCQHDQSRVSKIRDYIEAIDSHTFDLEEASYKIKIESILKASRKAMVTIRSTTSREDSRKVGWSMIRDLDERRRQIRNNFSDLKSEVKSIADEIHSRLSVPNQILIIHDEEGNQKVAELLS